MLHVAEVRTYTGDVLWRSVPEHYRFAYRAADRWRLANYPNGNIALRLVSP